MTHLQFCIVLVLRKLPELSRRSYKAFLDWLHRDWVNELTWLLILLPIFYL